MNPSYNDVVLIDDGTLDTVVNILGHEVRFFDTSNYRDKDGRFTKEGWKEICKLAIEEYEENKLDDEEKIR